MPRQVENSKFRTHTFNFESINFEENDNWHLQSHATYYLDRQSFSLSFVDEFRGFSDNAISRIGLSHRALVNAQFNSETYARADVNLVEGRVDTLALGFIPLQTSQGLLDVGFHRYNRQQVRSLSSYGAASISSLFLNGSENMLVERLTIAQVWDELAVHQEYMQNILDARKAGEDSSSDNAQWFKLGLDYRYQPWRARATADYFVIKSYGGLVNGFCYFVDKALNDETTLEHELYYSRYDKITNEKDSALAVLLNLRYAPLEQFEITGVTRWESNREFDSDLRFLVFMKYFM
jgi:hypothetical protein